jgi:hypothetical protein
MKTFRIVSSVVLVALITTLLSCESNTDFGPQKDLLPETFTIDIPGGFKTGGTAGRVQGDTLHGNIIYLNLATFIAVGDGSAFLVEEFINGIRKHNIDRVLSLSFKGDDNRIKNLVVTEDPVFEGATWQYMLTVTDADSEGQANGGKALQIFWNKTAPIKGIAIVNPYHCDRNQNANIPAALFRIDYTEESSNGYEAQMEVRVSGLPLESPLSNPYSISTLHMWAGKKGDIIDVRGNSNHPNAIFFSGQKGFNWAFVASGSASKDIGVAEVGLPASTLDASDRETLLVDYSIRNVFISEITAVWPGIDPALLAAFLKNTAAPGYFNNKGFVAGGTSPGTDWNIYAGRLDELTPYNPVQTTNLLVEFK